MSQTDVVTAPMNLLSTGWDDIYQAQNKDEFSCQKV